MPDSVLEGRGAQVTPVAGAPLYTNRFFSGLWTQSSPLRDAATPYLYEMFYSASRFERLIGGGNIEISPRLTVVRRPGSTVYNTSDIPPVNRFFEFRAFSAGSEDIRLLASCAADGSTPPTVRDVTGPTNNVILWDKQSTAGKTFFQSVGNECFFSDGIDLKKYLLSGKQWQPNTQYKVGDFIIDSNGNVQEFQAQNTNLTITTIEGVTQSPNALVSASFVVITLSATAPPIPVSTFLIPSGITGAPFTAMNGDAQQFNNIAPGWNLNLAANQIAIRSTSFGVVAPVATPGTLLASLQEDANGNALMGTSGATQPTWGTGRGATVQDGSLGTGVTWSYYGPAVQDWTVAAPTAAPVLSPLTANAMSYWASQANYAANTAILDPNGSYQVSQTTASTGPIQPQWNTGLGALTQDGGQSWKNVGQLSNWYAEFQYTSLVTSILDSNSNLQTTINYYTTQTIWTAGIANTTGANDTTGSVEPVWATARGAATNDNTFYIWDNNGPAQQLTAGTLQYAYSYHSVDGSVTTASPVSYIVNPVLGVPGLFEVSVFIPYSQSLQVDEVWIWRTAGGQSTLVLLDIIPNYSAFTNIEYQDVLPDTSTSGQQALNPFILAPVNDSNDPPPAGFIPMAYHLTRICGAVGNILYLSQGPDAITGNGNTAFNPVAQFTLPSLIVAMWSTTIGLIIFRIDGITVMLGNGIGAGSLYCVDIFDNVGLPSQDAYDVRGNTVYMMTTTGKVLKLSLSQFMAAVQGELSQGLEDYEIGFPIGDTLCSTYTPADAFAVWHEGPSEDSGFFIGDGQEGWFNLKQLTQPEVCNPWSPKAIFESGCGAMASVETSPGIRSLLFSGFNLSGTPGPIMQRDLTTYEDIGEPFIPFATFGSIVMAQPGTQATVQFVVLETTEAGTRPTVGLLIDEISGPFRLLTKVRKADPPNLPPSQSVPASRFWAMEGQKPVGCRHLQMQITWAAENAMNELLTTAIYGRLPEKARR